MILPVVPVSGWLAERLTPYDCLSSRMEPAVGWAERWPSIFHAALHLHSAQAVGKLDPDAHGYATALASREYGDTLHWQDV